MSKLDSASLNKISSNFSYTEEITRKDLANLLYGVLAERNITTAITAVSFKDSAIDPALEFCVNAGLMKGYGNNTFKPNKTLTRAEFAQVITRLNNVLQKSSVHVFTFKINKEMLQKATLPYYFEYECD